MFNYRMHPSNLRTIQAARIDYVSLANNHTLDFQQEGLVDTIRAVEEAGIKYAGAGHTTEAACTPATLRLPRAHSTNISYAIKVFAASDNPADWRQGPNFHLIDYTKSSKAHLKQIVSAHSHEPDLRTFSVHWGPNYAWRRQRKYENWRTSLWMNAE
jgi:poly-gamma-glutamate capsule biosynthesis protein CapA/YwtB (metallophosphatase superfamily)